MSDKLEEIIAKKNFEAKQLAEAQEADLQAFKTRALARFDEELKSWRDQRDSALRQEREKEAERAEQVKMEQDYFQAYSKYYRDADAIHIQNREVVEKVQALYNKPVTLYELTYGVVATAPVDEGDWETPQKYLETRKVVVRTSGEKSGSFLGMDNNPIKYWHPVSTRMITATALEPNGAAREYHGLPTPFDGDGFDLGVYYLVGSADDEEIETALRDHGWQDYPEKPAEPSFANYEQAWRIRNAVMNGVTEFNNEIDIPY